MHLHLSNFKCYRGKHSFDFDDEGITLISGPSGAGKSTLFNAIDFCLYGKVTKCVSEGEDTCSVILQQQEVTITRTCRPNHLILEIEGEKYHDVDAQARICALFGAFFDHVSYVTQHAAKSFLAQSSQEKIDILEKLIFDNLNQEVQPSALRKKCQVLARQTTSQLDKITGSCAILARHTGAPSPSPALPPEAQTLESQLEYHRVLKRQYLYLKAAEKLTSLKAEMERVRARLQTAAPLDPPKYGRIQLENHLAALRTLEGLQSDKYAEFTVADCEEEIETLEGELKQAKEYERARDELAACSFKPADHEVLRREVERLESTVEKVYSCPWCKKNVGMRDGALESIDTLPREVSNRAQILSAARKALAKSETLEGKYNELAARLASLMAPEGTAAFFQDQLVKWRRYHGIVVKIAAAREGLVDSSLSAAEANAGLSALKHNQECEAIQAIAARDETRLKTAIAAIEEEMLNLGLYDEGEYAAQLQTRRQNAALEDKRYQEWKQYEADRAELEGLVRERAKLERRIVAYQKLKQMVTRTELEHLEETIRRIEHLVNVYCAQLFDEPFHVHISLFADSKTQETPKPQFELWAFHKGFKTTYGALSGGEQARLNLSFTLALANCFGARILLLDECTSQLNQEAAERMNGLIKEAAPCKALVIAHQVVEGAFDQVVSL